LIGQTVPVPFFHSLCNFARKLMTYEDVTPLPLLSLKTVDRKIELIY
jgi:hypothetical protein